MPERRYRDRSEQLFHAPTERSGAGPLALLCLRRSSEHRSSESTELRDVLQDKQYVNMLNSLYMFTKLQNLNHILN